MKTLSIAIVGCGPAGIASAVECKAGGIKKVAIFEKSDNFCATLRKLYPPHKRVDRDYKGFKMDSEGICTFETETKEEFLKRMLGYIKEYSLEIHYNIEINGLEKGDKHYILKAGTYPLAKAYVVIIATGVFDKPRKPSYPIPEEVKNRVFFELPQQLPEGEKILIVGGGNTAAELACLLAGKCDVVLSYRRHKFFRINEQNLKELEKKKEKIKFFMGTEIKGIEPAQDAVKVVFRNGHAENFSKIFYCLGGSTPKSFLEKLGIRCENSDPVIDEYGESNLERVFLAGDIAVKRGSIMYAFNSAHRVVKRIMEKYPGVFQE